MKWRLYLEVFLGRIVGFLGDDVAIGGGAQERQSQIGALLGELANDRVARQAQLIE